MTKIPSNSQPHTFTRALGLLVIIAPILSLICYSPARALSELTGGGGDPVTPPVTTPVTPPTDPTPTPPVTEPNPSASPTATPTPSPSPSPTNNLPVITTTSLPAGKVGVAYSATVRATDDDTKNGLNMMATNLPKGLTMNDCTVKLNATGLKKVITCTIEGTPVLARTKVVNIVVADSKGGIDSAAIPLTIN